VDRLELFFDLVFVFAFFNVTRVLAERVSAAALVHSLLVLALLWWSWCTHTLLANRVRLGEGVAPMVMFVAMPAVFLMALSISQAFVDQPGGLSGPLIFAGCYFAVRALHLAFHWYGAREDPAERRQLLRAGTPLVVAVALLVVAGLLPGRVDGVHQIDGRLVLWALAVLVEYATGFALGLWGWRLASAGHWVERYDLIVIVAFGELIISLGIGSGLIGGRAIGWPTIAASVLGIAITVMLWWAYFDIVAPGALMKMHRTRGRPRIALARDAYIYLHLPIIAGLILVALGGEEYLRYVGHRYPDLSVPLPGPGVPVLYAGVVLYLLGHLAFQLRILHNVTWTRVVAVVVITALIPAGMSIPVLVSLGLLTVLLLALVAAELVFFAETRRTLREASLEERLAHEARETEWRRRRYE
jgi:low temperature requirement protein LtrA